MSPARHKYVVATRTLLSGGFIILYADTSASKKSLPAKNVAAESGDAWMR